MFGRDVCSWSLLSAALWFLLCYGLAHNILDSRSVDKDTAYHLRQNQSCIDSQLDQTLGVDFVSGSNRPHPQATVLGGCLKSFVIEDVPHAGICSGQKSGYDAILLLAHIGCFAEAGPGNLRPGLGGAAGSTWSSDSRAPGWPLRTFLSWRLLRMRYTASCVQIHGARMQGERQANRFGHYIEVIWPRSHAFPCARATTSRR